MIQGFTLETTVLSSGRRVFALPYMAISDTHLGDPASEADRICHMMQNIRAERLDLVGDIVEMASPDFPSIHRQCVAEIVRRASEGSEIRLFHGNHDAALGGLVGRSICGVRVARKGVYESPDRRRYLIDHGHGFEEQANKDKKHGALCNLFNTGYAVLYSVDPWLRHRLNMEFSIAAALKQVLMPFIDRGLKEARKLMADAIDEGDYDGSICGHFHTYGFRRTPAGNLMIDPGCSIDRSCQGVLQDNEGRFAVFKWRKNGIDFHLQDGRMQHASFADLAAYYDMPDLLKPAQLTQDRHTRAADRLLRIIPALSPLAGQDNTVGHPQQAGKTGVSKTPHNDISLALAPKLR